MKLQEVKPKMLIECDCYGAHYRVRVAKVSDAGIDAKDFRARTNGVWHKESCSGGHFSASYEATTHPLSNIRRAKVKRV